MGCISSKAVFARSRSSSHHLLAFLSPSQPAISALHLDHNLTDFEDAKHTIDALELMPDTEHQSPSKSCQSSPVIERCASFHTVEEYDAMLQRISTSGDEKEIVTTQNDDEKGIRRKKTGEALAGSLDIEFQTVGSLRQWLHDHVHSPATTDHPTPKFGSYYGNNNAQGTGGDSVFIERQEEECMPEVDPDLVAAFEEYMQQLQVEEDNVLKLIEADQ